MELGSTAKNQAPNEATTTTSVQTISLGTHIVSDQDRYRSIFMYPQQAVIVNNARYPVG
jgi:hypothetical protein